MRIKLNLMKLIPNRNPSTYWLHIDVNCIVYIKHLKEKIKRVLKESREIELCLDGVLFFDEDDIYVIHENEEIIVTVKENSNYSEPNKLNVDTSVLPSDNISWTETVEVDSEALSIQAKGSKKRLRKRTHKKKESALKPIEQIENNSFDEVPPSNIIPITQTSKMHKRFKLNNDNNFSNSESSNEDNLHLKNEIVHNNSLPLNCEKKYIEPIWKKEKQFKSKVNKVPVFVRGQASAHNNFNNISYSENENHKDTETYITENNDEEVVDWKSMSKIKITDISELQIHDVLQFKILALNELGEAAVSSTITTRLEHINGSTLLIEVLSGVKEFMAVNHKFNMDDEENITTRREIEFQDLFELVKLV